jgi:kinesin family protein 6/9
VFERVARPVVAGVLAGFNGTVFAYGQTGSGKTFTMTGGAERYADRGLIPRAISAVFDALSSPSSTAPPPQPPPAGDQEHAQRRPRHHHHHHHNTQVLISYLEIYNEAGYDLLDPRRDATPLADMPQVSVGRVFFFQAFWVVLFVRFVVFWGEGCLLGES